MFSWKRMGNLFSIHLLWAALHLFIEKSLDFFISMNKVFSVAPEFSSWISGEPFFNKRLCRY